MRDLVPRLRALALLAKSAGMGLNIDAEEADRLALSLDVIDTVLANPPCGLGRFRRGGAGLWPARGPVIDSLYDMADRHDRRIMVRLVKGAYWDTEIKRAQVEGIDGFPGFHPQGRHRCQLYRQRAQTAGHDRPHLSAIRHP